MKKLSRINDSFTSQELFAQYKRYTKEIYEFYNTIPTSLYKAKCSTAEVWSIQRSLEHILSNTAKFSFLVSLPIFIYRYLGHPEDPNSRVQDFDPFPKSYGIESGIYLSGKSINPKEKARLLRTWIYLNGKYKASLERFSNFELDHFRVPGYKYSLRQFTLYMMLHNMHFSNEVRQRLENSQKTIV